MSVDFDQIQRLGFEAWADNLIADAMENIGNDAVALRHDDGDVSVTIELIGPDYVCNVRAYVPGDGWQTHERTIRRY